MYLVERGLGTNEASLGFLVQHATPERLWTVRGASPNQIKPTTQHITARTSNTQYMSEEGALVPYVSHGLPTVGWCATRRTSTVWYECECEYWHEYWHEYYTVPTGTRTRTVLAVMVVPGSPHCRCTKVLGFLRERINRVVSAGISMERACRVVPCRVGIVGSCWQKLVLVAPLYPTSQHNTTHHITSQQYNSTTQHDTSNSLFLIRGAGMPR